ncbi:hypothetical protein D3C86_2094390 [compost metagenome]
MFDQANKLHLVFIGELIPLAPRMRPAGREGNGVHQHGFRPQVSRGECQAEAGRRVGQ